MGRDEDRLKARARLALRAEKAFGLDSVALPRAEHVLPQTAPATLPPTLTPPPAHEPDGPLPVPSGAAATPATRPTATPITQPTLLPFAPASAGPISPTVLPSQEKVIRLSQLDENEVRGCRRCRLCEHRTHTVFGEGSPDARIFFIGEGPGATEDRTGRPFVGRAGELLNKQIGAMGLRREEVYIANCVKCRPPGNRTPATDEVSTCSPYLERQLEIIRPEVIVTLGLAATQFMLQTKNSMSRMRGQWHTWRGIKLMPTFHPAYLLRSYTQQNRAMVWSDLQQVMRELGMRIPRADGAK